MEYNQQGAPSGYVRKDNTLKPSYHMLRKLVKDEWWTDTTVKTDSEGNTMIEAYKGDYCFEVDGMSGKANLTDNNPVEIMVLG